MSTVPLSSATPSEVEVDARGVLALLDALEADPSVTPHSLMVLRHGRVLAEGWWAPYSRERRHLLYSLSKTFTAVALGLAVDEGLVSLDDRVVDHLPDLADTVTDAGTLSLRLRHLASMSTGHTADTWLAALAGAPEEPVRAFLGMPPQQAPGSVFAYNQSATYTLATILQRVTGTTLTGFLRPRLLDPLGIGPVCWQQHPAGQDIGFSGLFAPTDAIARLGLLLLNGGRWNGQQLLSDGWVAEATRTHVATDREENPDWAQGYGFGVWRSRHGYRGDGAYGQFCLVLPDEDLVVALTAETEAMQAVLDAVWAHLLPAVGRASSAVADHELAERCAGLALPPYAAPTDAEVAPRLASAVLLPEPGRAQGQPSLARVELQRAVAGWRVTLVEKAGEHEVALPIEVVGQGWTVTGTADEVPTAVSGGATASGDLELRVLFLETPHELVLTCGTEGFTTVWSTPPLGGLSLHGLRCPAPA